jgi:protein involved in polysaccharide export with SLBB domain
MRNRFSFIPACVLLAFSLNVPAQSYAAGQAADGQPGVDCTDPANAASAACLAWNGQQPSYANGQAGAGALGAGRPALGIGPQSGGLQNGPTYVDNGGSSRSPANSAMLPAPPEPLTDFQKMLASTYGQVLPIFGQDLFRGVPSTFAPVDQIPVTSDYVVGPGDEIRIRVWGQVNFNADVKVDRSGDIYLPQVGRIHVTGTEFSGLNQQIRAQIARVYRNFDLTVDLGQLRSIQVFVVGQARRPGVYTVSSLSTLVNAIFASGGPSVQGSMRRIQLKREGAVVTTFDFYDLLLRGDKSKDARLLPGDVIFIPAVGPQVALIGSVRKPAIYELDQPEVSPGESTPVAADTVQRLIDDAGGLSVVAAASRMSIDRIDEHRDRQTVEVALDAAGLATALRDGDVVRILSITPSFQKTVTLRGNLANPGRFAWREGMKLSDLLPDRPSLITRDYWWRRAQLGLPGPEFEPLSGRGTLFQPALPGYLPPSGAAASAANPRASLAPDMVPGWQDSTAVNGQAVADATTAAPNAQRPSGVAAQNESGGASLASEQSDVVTENIANAGPKIGVTLSAPEIDWDYAVIERLDPNTLKTWLLPFNLGKLVVNHDPSQDLALQPGDVVTIFSQADIHVPLNDQTKFVRLDGEIASAGVYSVSPGETLRDVVRRAGGLTPNAYLFGSEFTRESTRVFQQQRLDEYVQSLELQVQRGTLNQAASAASAQDTAAASAASVNQQGLLARLHQLRATGRIVLEVKPDSAGLDSIPELSLQDDDHFTIPPVPATVNVVGAVYNQNSFLYNGQRRFGDYLHLAGGANRNADKSHIFIIRADGSVESRESANGLWGNNFAATRMYPGDTIVVPEKVLGSSVLRSFINWSQVFSQLALGVAAIAVLHNN